MHKSEGTVGKGVFYGGPCQGVIRRTTGARIGSWKGAAIQTGLQPGSRGTAIIGAVTRQLLVKTLWAGKDLVCV
jgi:hypothetical protein